MAIDKVKYWKELADYDIETAEVMYNGGRWLYVGFMCHLVIEKTMDREHALMIVKCYKEAILPLLANAKVYLYGSCSRKSPILLSQAGWGFCLCDK